MADIIRNTDLKTAESLEAQLKFAAQTLATVKARFIAIEKSAANKPASYGADEEYTQLFKLGPVVTDLVEAVKKLEDEIVELNRFIGEQLGNSKDEAVLPPVINIDGKVQISADANGDLTFQSLV